MAPDVTVRHTDILKKFWKVSVIVRLKFSWGKNINLDPIENVYDFEKRIQLAVLMSNDGLCEF